MLLNISLTAAVLLALGTSASSLVTRKSPVTVPLTCHYNFTRGSDIADIDRTRFRTLRDRSAVKTSQAGVFPVPVTNSIVTYTAEVGIGQPATLHNLLVDTGSSNTWIGANSVYSPSSSATPTGRIFEVQYGSGIVFGDLWIDTVTLGNSFVITGQGIGVAELSEGFTTVDGILGIGPTDLTEGTTSGLETVPTVTDTAYSNGLLDERLVGISFEPATSDSDPNGELTFGGVDSAKFTGDINYIPITSTSPASSYVGIDQEITYGSSRLSILPTTSGITDTGTTLILLSQAAFNLYTAATGAVMDQTTGLLRLTSPQYAALESLYFTIGGVEYEFTANAQRWPEALNAGIGGTQDGIYLVVGNAGDDTGGINFINGYTFLERFYTVYDSGPGASRFGIAETPYTFATSN
ncbi:aspartic peptidase domain-containing protein [Cytidiella melzeri]|nr:aspartic peptidase domain-containing protein [Cytidiella melzeri]